MVNSLDSNKPVAWVEVASDGTILGVSLDKDDTSPFILRPLYTAPVAQPVICEMCGDNADYYAGDAAHPDRESLAALMIKHSFATGHGETHADLIRELDWQLTEFRSRAAQSDAEKARVSRSLAERTAAPFNSVDPNGQLAREWQEKLGYRK